MNIHPSHKMLEWEHTIVCISSAPRFGKIRRCEFCEAEQVETVAGEVMDPQLRHECCDAQQTELDGRK